ncbi:MAG: adenosylcobinamide-GDP ribazoletransferase [Bacteroidales bacterium]|jgi:adenosylcobinamide-GDP ribazoletransferase|nr:adenosylcobinamide-GDP ribazoletransferase [Bacteroidales bacterium]
MNELKILGSSLLYFTRLKLPFEVPYSKENMSNILTWFPLVGAVVGVLGASVWWVFSLILPSDIAILLSMVATILFTGGFHEDGLADVCDGFGGGYGKDRILVIMKDSSTGAYGVMGMVLALLTKFVTLSNIAVREVFLVIVIGHTLSRALTLLITQIWTYARSTKDSKARAVSQKLSPIRFVIIMATGMAPLYFSTSHMAWYFPVVGAIVALMMGNYFHKHIDGYTGDCLGATQQVIEVVIYCSFLMLQ